MAPWETQHADWDRCVRLCGAHGTHSVVTEYYRLRSYVCFLRAMTSAHADLCTSAADMNWTCLVWGAPMLMAIIWWFVDARKWFKGPKVSHRSYPLYGGYDKSLTTSRSTSNTKCLVEKATSLKATERTWATLAPAVIPRKTLIRKLGRFRECLHEQNEVSQKHAINHYLKLSPAFEVCLDLSSKQLLHGT